MKVNGQHFRTIWHDISRPGVVTAINQLFLPHRFVTEDFSTHLQIETAIKDMHLRGAPLIGAAAAWGMYLAALDSRETSDALTYIREAGARLKATRPTAVNLAWSVDEALRLISGLESPKEMSQALLKFAQELSDGEAARCRLIGEHGLPLLEEIFKRKQGRPINILTHCNAGWLACVDFGTATAPIYLAHERGIPLHVWVDETRPRNQGASLTAWEMSENGVPHTVIADNTGGHLMQHGMVDIVITGADRVTRSGDAANKIGTYLKALAARDNGVPFYIALPSSTFDWKIDDGVRDIPIEERDADEVKYIQGLCDGALKKVLVTPERSPAANYGFDVTPARLITGLITEQGICGANRDGIRKLFPDLAG